MYGEQEQNQLCGSDYICNKIRNSINISIFTDLVLCDLIIVVKP